MTPPEPEPEPEPTTAMTIRVKNVLNSTGYFFFYPQGSSDVISQAIPYNQTKEFVFDGDYTVINTQVSTTNDFGNAYPINWTGITGSPSYIPGAVVDAVYTGTRSGTWTVIE